MKMGLGDGNKKKNYIFYKLYSPFLNRTPTTIQSLPKHFIIYECTRSKKKPSLSPI